MKVSAQSIRILYRTGKIGQEGLRQAAERGWITQAEYEAAAGAGGEGPAEAAAGEDVEEKAE